MRLHSFVGLRVRCILAMAMNMTILLVSTRRGLTALRPLQFQAFEDTLHRVATQEDGKLFESSSSEFTCLTFEEMYHAPNVRYAVDIFVAMLKNQEEQANSTYVDVVQNFADQLSVHPVSVLSSIVRSMGQVKTKTKSKYEKVLRKLSKAQKRAIQHDFLVAASSIPMGLTLHAKNVMLLAPFTKYAPYIPAIRAREVNGVGSILFPEDAPIVSLNSYRLEFDSFLRGHTWLRMEATLRHCYLMQGRRHSIVSKAHLGLNRTFTDVDTLTEFREGGATADALAPVAPAATSHVVYQGVEWLERRLTRSAAFTRYARNPPKATLPDKANEIIDSSPPPTPPPVLPPVLPSFPPTPLPFAPTPRPTRNGEVSSPFPTLFV